MNILIIPGTNLVAKEVVRSLLYSKSIKLYGAGVEIPSQNLWPYEAFHQLPLINSSSIEQVTNLVKITSANFIIFTHDDWLLLFASKEELCGAKIIKSSELSIRISSFKSETYKFFERFVDVPKIYTKSEKILNYPVFVKPDRGQGSKNTAIINNYKDFFNYKEKSNKNFIACEYLPGLEYTVDCFSDDGNQILYCESRLRENYFEGIAQSTRYVKTTSTIKKWAEIFSTLLKIRGAWFFQYKLNNLEKPVLLEIGMRIAGASGISRLRGVNLSLLNIHLFMHSSNKLYIYDQFNYAKSKRTEGFDLCFKFNEIFVDLDDTLIIDDRTNLPLLKFLNKNRIEGIPINIITRNQNPENLINKYRISRDLFNSIIRIGPSEKKSAFIDSNTFIFVDDSHSERMEVKRRFKASTLVLDPSFCWQN
jgi:hypothetical protein